MEWEIDHLDVEDQILKLSFSKNFHSLMRLRENNSDINMNRWIAAQAFEADLTFQRLIAQLGFTNEEEVHAKSREQNASLITRMERLHDAASKAKKERDFVSGLDLGTLQENLVEIFLMSIDEDLDHILNQYHGVAFLETLLKSVLIANESVSWIKWQLELTGSAAEGAQVADVNYEDGDQRMTLNPEYDIMVSVSRECLGLSHHQNCITDANYPGFVYLSASSPSNSENSENLLKVVTSKGSKQYLSALKFRTEMYRMFDKDMNEKNESTMEYKVQATIHGPAIQVDVLDNDSQVPDFSLDVVPAIRFSGWPVCCSAWPERKRAWPPAELVKEIVGSGFRVVSKTSPQGDEELEWRLSFSTAEIKLMSAKGMGNRNYCYRMFKTAIKGTVMSTCKLLTSYHLKTLLLWASERHPPDYWLDDNIAVCFLGLLDDLLHALVNHSLPHYFIPKLNLLANCSPDHLYHIASQVSAIRQCPVKRLQIPGSDPKGYENFMAAMKEWKEMDYGAI